MFLQDGYRTGSGSGSGTGRGVIDDEAESAFSDITGRSQQQQQFVHIDKPIDGDIPSTHLPTLTAASNDSRVGLAKSLPFASIDASRLSTAEKQNALIKAWAVLLHLYCVSDAVSFVVIGGEQTHTSRYSSQNQIVVSRWSPTERSAGPQLQFGAFVAHQNDSKINTAINFDDVYRTDDSNTFSYILHWCDEGAADVRLFTRQASVPAKFASAVWNTMLEVHSSLASRNAREIGTSSVSKADQRAIRAFLPSSLYEGQRCLHQLFEDSARAAPQSPAVQASDGSLTYAQLDSLSDKVAAQLVRLGVRVGDIVPFSFEKSMWMVVAVLAILKAGGTMTPIDPAQPLGRAQEILGETHSEIIVASPSQASRFKPLVDTVLVLSADGVQDFADNQRTSLPQVRPQDAAMIIFTSGSTGKPKGIVIQHGAVSTRMIAEGRAFQYHGARTLQFAASTWDIFMTDIFTTTAFQGCICIPSEEDRRFNLARFCTDNNVTLALITPSLASLLEPSLFPTLKTLIFGGEALREEVVSKWTAIKGLSLYQGYGPAETGPCVAARLAERPNILGYALDNSICVLVDPNNHDRLVPLGAVGELVVGGPSLLRHYINNPGQTRKAVIESPEWCFDLDMPVRRFYRTGDLLRYSIDSLDGRLEFVGRTDDQVKYHGQRIELKEIEHHLGQMSGISSSMVALIKTGFFKDRLVAVVEEASRRRSAKHTSSRSGLSVCRDSGLTITNVRESLALGLPEYMIPNELIVVEEMPHNSSMKLDRAAVTKWISEMQTAPDASAARTSRAQSGDRLLAHEATARAVAREYARIVAGDNAARCEEFENLDFNLQDGGIDSVQIMSLSMALTSRYGVQVPMAKMLSSRATVRTIAAVLDQDKEPEARHEQPLRDVQDEINLSFRSIASSASRPDYQGSSVHRVFLTGASGFLGIEILRQLLTRSNCHVYALVRASSQRDAEERLIQNATAAGWWRGELVSRLHVWQGDLAKSQLGLDHSQWQMLLGQTTPSIDAIVHNGAKVHYNLDYESLKATNVASTVELLKAVNSRDEALKSFVYVSGGQQLSFDERHDATRTPQAVNGSGYARSKVVSELIVRRFAEQQDSKARHVRVVKPGFIIGDVDNGVANQADFIWRLIAASVNMGAYNNDESDTWLFVSDIARVSRSVLQAIFEHDCEPVLRVLDGMRFKSLWSMLQGKFGYEMQPLGRKQWLSRLSQDVAVKREKHVMFPLMHMLESSDETVGVPDGPKKPSADVEAAMEANITHLIKAGFLPPVAAGIATPTTSCDQSVVSVSSETDVIDVKSIRDQFPALHHGVVAFNNAAGTVLHREAAEGTHKYMTAFPYELGRDDPQSQAKTQRLMDTYKELAAFMNADADEVAFGQTSTYLLRSLGQAMKPLLNSDCEMIVSNLCHEASAASWINLAKDLQIAIKWWSPPPGDDPTLSLETLKPLLSPKTRIVACNHVSNVVGTIHPIRQIADLVHSIPGAVFVVDGVAYAPHRPVDVKALDVDFYCFSWYKVFGPHVAQLYGRRSAQKRVMAHSAHYFLSDMPGLDWRLRLGANSFELEAALVPITRYLTKVGWEGIVAQETLLQETLLAYLRRRPRTFRIFGEKSSDASKRVAVITFQVLGRKSLDVTNAICRKGRFRVVSGNCWAPRPTHDVLRLDDDGLIRVSFVHYNTVSEVREFCRELDSVLEAA